MIRKLTLASVALVLFVSPLAVMAQTSSFGNTPPTSSFGNTPPPPASVNPTPLPAGGSYTVQNPLGNNVNSVCGLIKAVLNAVLQIGIPVAVLFIVWAGFKFVLARGNPTGLTDAKKNLYYTIIGIAIFLGAWLIGQVIANTINNLQQGSSSQVSITACN